MIHQPPGRFAPPTIQRFRCDVPVFAQDRVDFRSAASAFKRAKALVKRYGARLRKVARDIDSLVRHYDVMTAEGQTLLQAALQRYRADLGQYAERKAEEMVAEVAKADARDWRKMSAEIGRAVHREIETAPTGAVMRRLQAENVHLITSLPRDAAERVQRIAREGVAKGMRPDTLAKEILATGQVTKDRADLIARTEVGRASTTLTQARAEHVGSTGYIWRTARDGTVRDSHRKMEGRFVAWAEPPTLDKLTGHAGATPNCRCWCEPILDD